MVDNFETASTTDALRSDGMSVADACTLSNEVIAEYRVCLCLCFARTRFVSRLPSDVTILNIYPLSARAGCLSSRTTDTNVYRPTHNMLPAPTVVTSTLLISALQFIFASSTSLSRSRLALELEHDVNGILFIKTMLTSNSKNK